MGLPREADVVIVGAGYTGLWTAYSVLRARPGLAVLLEAGRVCESRGATLTIAHAPPKLSQLAALYGVEGLLGLQPA